LFVCFSFHNDLKEHLKKQLEVKMALNLAITMANEGKYDKASKIFKHALCLDPKNADVLTSYGEFLETHKNDIIRAEHLYTRVLSMQPEHNKAAINLKRASPLVTKIDRQMLDKIDKMLKQFYAIPSTNMALRRAKREAYFMHIYHSNAIEGNTLNLKQTRYILESRMAIPGKSLLEHQEVLGLDAAMRFINETLLYRPIGELSIQDILDIHRRVLGFSDPIESGSFRQHQVYVGNFVPPSPLHVERLMNEFIEWLNSYQLLNEAHPIQIAALAHYKFVYIHPFYDGNGRTGRLLMNLILMRAGYPPIIIRKQERLEYYDYLEMANLGDIKPFIRFIARCTERTLEEYIQLCNKPNEISNDEFEKIIRINELVSSLSDDENDDEVLISQNDYLFAEDKNKSKIYASKESSSTSDNDDDSNFVLVNDGKG
jgi:Fic family protein